jgi:hypothetical protein
VRRFTALALLSVACHHRPPAPGPTPSPTPTPAPIKVVAGKFVPQPSGWVGCCNTPPRDGALGWTLAEPIEIDAYVSVAADVAVFRTGPYSDQGNGWGYLESSSGESRLRRTCKYANSKGVTCLVEAGTDHWALRHSEFNLYNDNCEVTRGGPPERYQRWSRAVVREVGDLNVLWSLGNEGWLCNPSPQWYDGLVNVIRTAETDFGMPHHPIGNVWAVGQVGMPRYDFAEVHGAPDLLASQPDIGIPVILTESENESPPESNARWLACRDDASRSGGKRACLVWRGGIEDAQWDQLFGRLGGHSPTRGPRRDSVCLWNKDGHANQPLPPQMTDAEAQKLADAVERVIVKQPWLFVNGGDNLACKGTPEDDTLRADFFSMLAAELGPGCSIAGNPDAPNSYVEVDNIEVQDSSDPCKQNFDSAGVHEIVFGNPGNFCRVLRGSAVRNGFKGRNRWTTPPLCTVAGP